jgi:peptidoglycan/LPS O-acetylase OafA/YrhL
MSAGAQKTDTRLRQARWRSAARVESLAPSAVRPTVDGVAARQHSGYRPDIDGLRAVAVLSVLAYHAGLGVASGGFVGVDVFFVISGYVISKSLLTDLDRRRFSVLGFYERRVRRIFPALFVTLIATWCAAAALLLPSYLEDFGKSLTASALFGSNFYFWLTSGYFANGAQLRPLLHTWSLSVEEQFYIFAPLTLALVYRFMGRRWLLALVPVVLASFGLSLIATRIGPTANFFLLPTRAWELGLGAILALRPPPLPLNRWVVEALAIAGAALILVAIFGYSDATPFPGLAALPPCLGTAMLIHAGAGAPSTATRLLARPPMVAVGLISYSLYLVHWPIVSFFTYESLRPPGPAEGAAIIAASLALAYGSWRFVERPFRSPSFRPGRKALLGGALAAMAIAAALGGVAVATHGFAQRYVQTVASPGAPSAFGPPSPCFLDHDPDPRAWSLAACTLTHGGPAPALLWGDSYAAHYVAGIKANADRIPFRVIEYTAAGCPPVLSYSAYNRPGCQAFNRNALEIIKRYGVKTVVLSARWVDLQRRGLEELTSTLRSLRALGVRTYVIGQTPMFTIDVNVIDSRRAATGRAESWPISFKPDLNRRLAALAGPDFVDPLRYTCRGDSCLYRDRAGLLFGDDGHFTAEGSLTAVAAYFPLLRPAAVSNVQRSHAGAPPL